MASGGYRASAGRKPGSKNIKTAAKKGKSKAKPTMPTDKQGKMKLYMEMVFRVANGEVLNSAGKKLMESLETELCAGLSPDERTEMSSENLDPLTYMLRVMNDATAEKDRRDRMAIAAAPFVHSRKEGKGKKDDKEDRARAAGAGKFSPGQAPLKVVK